MCVPYMIIYAFEENKALKTPSSASVRYMHALYVWLICMPYICALYVCL